MCGIGTIINMGNNNEKEICTVVNALYEELQKRGEDATGMTAIDEEGNSNTIKKPMKADKFILTQDFKTFMSKHWKSKVIILHTRAHTVGDPKKNYNNHPLESEHYIMVHNGMLRTYSEINDVVNNLGINHLWDSKVETDSYVMLKLAEMFGVDSIPKLTGTMAFVIFNKVSKDIYLFRNAFSMSLYAGFCDEMKLMVLASTDDAVKAAFSEYKNLYGLIKIKKDTRSYTIQELETDVLYKANLSKLVFTQTRIFTEFMDEGISSDLDVYYDNTVIGTVKHLYIHFKENVANKIKKELKLKGFDDTNDVYILKRKDFNKFVKCISKHKKKREIQVYQNHLNPHGGHGGYQQTGRGGRYYG